MYNKLVKGAASVLGAALVLGSVLMSVVPAQAASTKGADGYETIYKLSDCVWDDTHTWGIEMVDPSAVTVNYLSQWQAAYYSIPKEVLDAGFIGVRYKAPVDEAKVATVLCGDEAGGKVVIWAPGMSEAGTHKLDGGGTEYNTQYDTGVTWTEADLPSITKFGIEYFADDVPAEMTVKEVTFITKNAVGGEAAPAGNEETKTEDKAETTTTTTTSSKTGESTTLLWVVCALGGMLLMAASGMVVSEKKRR